LRGGLGRGSVLSPLAFLGRGAGGEGKHPSGNIFLKGRGWKRALLLLLALLCLSLLAFYIWLSADLPDPATITANLHSPSLRITDRNGRLLYDALPAVGGRHTVVDLETIPLTLRQATIATEDSHFYQNPGVDPIGILRSFWINLTGGETLAGGSTITQQVARNLLLDPTERSLRRKLRETLLAWKLTQRFSKDEILALYLNQMYYGSLAYGVEAAAQTYFGKPVAELDLAEAALLAGLPQTPALYDPFQYPEAAKKRQMIVLGLMEKAGFISAEQRALAESEPIVYNPRPFPILAPHFVMMIRREAEKWVTPEQLYAHGGLTIRTTLDLDWQQHAENTIRHQLERLHEQGQRLSSTGYNLKDAALVALDPANGEVLALVGSPDYFNAQISGAVNMATAPRQPGSALKPLIYAAAFDPQQPDPWTPATMLLDVSTNFTTHDGKAYTPANYDEAEHGPVLARQALASSLNIPAVLTLEKVGIQRLFSLAAALGISTLTNPDQYDLSLALGGGEISLIELTAAYGALAAGGVRVTPQIILDIRDPQGNLVHVPQPSPRPSVIDPRVAWLITDILADDDARQLGFGRNSVLRLDRPAAVKTGTTTNFHDNWTVGYTPDLVVGVWAGNANHEAMYDVNGLTGAAPIWHEFIRTVLAGRPPRAFVRPPDVVAMEVCTLSGLLPTPDCLYRRQEWFIAGTQPVRPDDLFRPVLIDPISGRLADEQTPPERKISRLALALPLQALPWAQANGQLLYSQLQTGAATSDRQVTGLQILSPPDRAVYQIAPGLSLTAQSLHIEITADPALVPIMLWVDESLVATFSAPPFEFWWPLRVGRHTLRVEASQVSQTISIEVK
jgi:penicillin-binding protein 1C